jgi:trans-aconitate methyltransferase
VTEPAQAPGAFFEQRYRRDPDPWQFATSPYEQRCYDITLASLPRQRYERAFEPGCSVGALTERLAARCGSLLAMDGAPTAVREARRRCAPQPHVEVCCGEVPTAWPAGGFDLILLSELGYYFTRPALEHLFDRALESLDPGGDLVAVHWRGESADHLLSGDEVHRILAVAARRDRAARQGPIERQESIERQDPIVSHIEGAFRLEVWRR